MAWALQVMRLVLLWVHGEYGVAGGWWRLAVQHAAVGGAKHCSFCCCMTLHRCSDVLASQSWYCMCLHMPCCCRAVLDPASSCLTKGLLAAASSAGLTCWSLTGQHACGIESRTATAARRESYRAGCLLSALLCCLWSCCSVVLGCVVQLLCYIGVCWCVHGRVWACV